MDFLKWKREKRERDTERQGRRETEGDRMKAKRDPLQQNGSQI